MLPKKLAFVDLETTGGRSFYDRVIEIGILRVEDGEITQTYSTLVNPEAHLPPEITILTGITAHDLEDAPTFRQIKDDVREILNECTFVAHNVRFDYGFLKSEFLRHEITYTSKHFCTVRLSRALYPQYTHHNLDAIIERFGFQCQNRHRAFDDAKILFHFYNKILQEFPLEHVQKAIDKALKKPSIPLKLKTDLANIPEHPGVYIFYGKSEIQNSKSETNTNNQNTKSPKQFRTFENSKLENCFDIRASNFEFQETTIPLYIGKSVNLKERIMSHFSADIHSPTEMKISQQIESIETIETAGELGALFLESALIKKMLPIYNKKSRLKRELIALKSQTNKVGYTEIYMEPITTIKLEELIKPDTSLPAVASAKEGDTLDTLQEDTLNQFLGFFKSRKQAKTYLAELAKTHGLCEKLLGLEKTKDACFAYRLGRCKGACVGKEKPILYNMKCTAAFVTTKIKPWPFPGPILIEETDGNIKEYFLINKWCYIGRIRIDSQGAKNDELDQNPIFDLDIYKILRQFIFRPQNHKKIKILTTQQLNEEGFSITQLLLSGKAIQREEQQQNYLQQSE